MTLTRVTSCRRTAAALLSGVVLVAAAPTTPAAFADKPGVKAHKADKKDKKDKKDQTIFRGDGRKNR
jgi:hypothetical protein